MWPRSHCRTGRNGRNSRENAGGKINTKSTPYHQDLADYIDVQWDAQGRKAASRESIERRVSETKGSSLVLWSSRLVVVAGRHAWLRRHAGPVALIPLLHIALICQGLLRVHGHVGHVVAGHVWLLGHARSAALRGEVLVGRLLRRFNLVTAVDAVFVAGSGLGSVQARLDEHDTLGCCWQVRLGRAGMRAASVTPTMRFRFQREHCVPESSSCPRPW